MLMGLMPAYRGGERPAWSLKEIVIVPGNPARGLDAHQGAVLLLDGETGELRALLNASRDHRDPHRRRVGGRDAGARARGRERRRDPRRRRPGALARRGDALRARPDAEIRTWSRGATAAPPRGTGPRSGADVVCTCTSAREPVLRREWLAPGAHVNAVGSSVPSARELDTETIAAATLFVDRRESALNEAGDLLLRRDRRGAHRAPSSARC